MAFDHGWLNELEPAAFAGVGYRSQTPGFDPRGGEGARRAGGRFNHRRGSPAVYLCLTRRCAAAELTRLAERQSVGVGDLLPRELWSLRVDVGRVLDLTDATTLGAARLTQADLVLADHTFTRQLGQAAHQRGYQAIRSFSTTGVDDVLVLFPENLGNAAVDVQLVERWDVIGDLE